MCVWVDEEPLAFFYLGPYDGHPFRAKNHEGSAGRTNLIELCDYGEVLICSEPLFVQTFHISVTVKRYFTTLKYLCHCVNLARDYLLTLGYTKSYRF